MIEPMKLHLLFLALLTLTFAACDDDTADVAPIDPDPTTAAIAPMEATTSAEDTARSNVRYSWVDDLNLRDRPTTSGEIVARIPTTSPLTLTGKETPNDQVFVLRGGLYVEPWYEVKTEDGKIGWVFGGAIKEETERKGNRPLSAQKFNYPHFGQFDLGRWEKESVDIGDTGSETITYRGDGQRIAIERAEGEYGYGITHFLYNLRGDQLRARNVAFNNETGELMEEIIDYMGPEPTLYRRTQSSPLSYQQLNAKPEVVRGEFVELSVDEAILSHARIGETE